MEGWIWEEIQLFLHRLNNQRGEIIACPHRPNGLGLYDMSGNVWELGADWYDKDYYKGSPKNNPQGPGSGKHRVVRGGSWNPNPAGWRASYRTWMPPSFSAEDLSFRVDFLPSCYFLDSFLYVLKRDAVQNLDLSKKRRWATEVRLEADEHFP
jgi:hypothetical protein